MERIAGVDGIRPAELHRRIQSGEEVHLLDLRGDGPYRAGHIAGSLSLTVDQSAGYLTRAGLPKGQLVVAICNYGGLSLQTTAIAQHHGYLQARNLTGGIGRWQAEGLPLAKGPPPGVSGELLKLPVVPLDLLSQLVLVAAGFVIKPTYMLLTLILILFMRRSTAPDLVLLRRAMVVFLIGEVFCALGHVPLIGGAPAILMHGVGMVVMGAYFSWGLFEFFDRRILRFSEPERRCAFQQLCGRCWKHEEVSCGLQQVFRFVAPALAIVSLIPLCSPLKPLRMVLPVFGTDFVLEHQWAVLVAEVRVFPAAAFVLFLVTSVMMWGGQRSIQRAKIPFFWAIGFMSYSLIRYFLLETFIVNYVWADWWEELTELLTIAGLGIFLIIFRRQLGIRWGKGEARPAKAP